MTKSIKLSVIGLMLLGSEVDEKDNPEILTTGDIFSCISAKNIEYSKFIPTHQMDILHTALGEMANRLQAESLLTSKKFSKVRFLSDQA